MYTNHPQEINCMAGACFCIKGMVRSNDMGNEEGGDISESLIMLEVSGVSGVQMGRPKVVGISVAGSGANAGASSGHSDMSDHP